ncbi:hypothetical protein QVD17_39585 [Tagetes erecta]|uniref:Uncharacterized protein n=1 Tax=Tagetes erecta TaxID=13708 RepID=A0AAD8NGD1_TARER|nr:hypothetical protein QVD17_39585 [Tagetes erecta]
MDDKDDTVELTNTMHTNPGKVKNIKRKTVSNDEGDGISLDDDIVLSKRKYIKKHHASKEKMPLESAKKAHSSVMKKGKNTKKSPVEAKNGIKQGDEVEDQKDVKHVDEVEAKNGIKQGDEAAQESEGGIFDEDVMIGAKLSCVLQEFNDCLQKVELVFKQLSNKYPTSMVIKEKKNEWKDMCDKHTRSVLSRSDDEDGTKTNRRMSQEECGKTS